MEFGRWEEGGLEKRNIGRNIDKREGDLPMSGWLSWELGTSNFDKQVGRLLVESNQVTTAQPNAPPDEMHPLPQKAKCLNVKCEMHRLTVYVGVST